MIATIEHAGRTLRVDLSKPLRISTSLHAGADQLRAWWVDPLRIEAVVGDNGPYLVKNGSPVNFQHIHFNPHGHGTHTECVGHITKEVHSVNQVLRKSFFLARLISLKPIERKNNDGEIDHVITKQAMKAMIDAPGPEALVLRTLPNDPDKLQRDHSGHNPPYLEAECCAYLRKIGVKHLLLDLPSVDRESDGGALAAHHAFWDLPNELDLERTITELIYVPDAIHDGEYLLELQLAPFENDASPSRPLLYAME